MTWARQEIGKTPRFLGINMGHRAIGSNAWHFMRRMGVNSARMFLYNTILCAPQPGSLPFPRSLRRPPHAPIRAGIRVLLP